MVSLIKAFCAGIVSSQDVVWSSCRTSAVRLVSLMKRYFGPHLLLDGLPRLYWSICHGLCVEISVRQYVTLYKGRGNLETKRKTRRETKTNWKPRVKHETEKRKKHRYSVLRSGWTLLLDEHTCWNQEKCSSTIKIISEIIKHNTKPITYNVQKKIWCVDSKKLQT